MLFLQSVFAMAGCQNFKTLTCYDNDNVSVWTRRTPQPSIDDLEHFKCHDDCFKIHFQGRENEIL